MLASPPSLTLGVLTMALMGVGCDRFEAPPAPPPSRVNAVAATKAEETTPAEFCDTWASADDATAFALPRLAGSEAPSPPKKRKKKKADPEPPALGPPLPTSTGWHWVNVWATWCEPCVEEMPMLLEWRKRLLDAGAQIELVFLSVDENDAVVAEFRSKHPGLPAGPRVADDESLKGWLGTVDLDASTAIPIHVFVDSAGKRRCVRTGSLLDYHYDAVAQIVAPR